jgi:chaperonin cofactor prefoldin
VIDYYEWETEMDPRVAIETVFAVVEKDLELLRQAWDFEREGLENRIEVLERQAREQRGRLNGSRTEGSD